MHLCWLSWPINVLARKHLGVEWYKSACVHSRGYKREFWCASIWSSKRECTGLLAGLSNVDRWMFWWHVCSHFMSCADTSIFIHSWRSRRDNPVLRPLSVSSNHSRRPLSCQRVFTCTAFIWDPVRTQMHTHCQRFHYSWNRRWDPDLLIEPREELWMCIWRWSVHTRAQNHHAEINVLAQISLHSEKN